MNSNKIIVYSSPQLQCLSTCSTETTDPVLPVSSINRVPKRTTYRVKISNSKDFEVLSTAAKFGLTSWVGGQKVRIVGVAPKQSNEFAAAGSYSLLASENNSDSFRAGFAPHPVQSQYASLTDCIYPSASAEERHHPGLNAAAATVASGSKCCTSSTFSFVGDSQSMHAVTCMPLQSCMTSTYQSSLVSDHSLHGSRCESLKPLTKLCESVDLQSLPCNVRYLGTVAVNTQNVTANSVSADDHTRSDESVTQQSVISAVKKFTDNFTGNKLPNGKHLSGPVTSYTKSNHVWRRRSSIQPLNVLSSSSAVSAKGLKRPYVEDCKPNRVSNKRMAHGIKCPTDSVDINFSDVTKSGTHRQPLTSNMLNQVATILDNCDQYTGYSQHSVSDTAKNSQQEVSNNCSSQLHLVPKFRLPSCPGIL